MNLISTDKILRTVRLFFKKLREANKKSSYTLKLDSFYFSKKNQDFCVIVRMLNKRKYQKILLNHIIEYREFIDQFHPKDNFVLGVLVGLKRNELIAASSISANKVYKIDNNGCEIKKETVIKMIKSYRGAKGETWITLKPCFVDKETVETLIKQTYNRRL